MRYFCSTSVENIFCDAVPLYVFSFFCNSTHNINSNVYKRVAHVEPTKEWILIFDLIIGHWGDGRIYAHIHFLNAPRIYVYRIHRSTASAAHRISRRQRECRKSYIQSDEHISGKPLPLNYIKYTKTNFAIWWSSSGGKSYIKFRMRRSFIYVHEVNEYSQHPKTHLEDSLCILYTRKSGKS